MPEQPSRLGESIGEISKDPIGAFLKRHEATLPEKRSFILGELDTVQRAELLGELYKEAQRQLEPPIGVKKPASTKDAKNQGAALAAIAELYADSETRAAYLDYWRRYKTERKTVNGSYDRYKQLRDQVDALELNFDTMSRALYSHRGERTSAMDKVLYQRTRRDLEKKREELAHLLEGSPKLAARVSYDRLCRYSDEFYGEHPFMWFPSRRKILEQLEQAALSGRPIRLIGESGTGKTAFVFAAARNMTGRLPFKFQGGPTTRLRDVLGYRDEIEGKTGVRYAELAQGMTGKKTSLDVEPMHAGGFVFGDEFTNFPKEVQIEIVKAVTNAKPGGIIHVPFIGEIVVAKNFLLIVADNPANDRYDRQPMDPAVAREFGADVRVDYPPQSLEEPELFEGMLAALMDVNHRVRFAKQELLPPVEYDGDEERGILEEVTVQGEKGVQEKKKMLKRHFLEDPKMGGFLWRFASVIGELYKSHSHQETVLRTDGVGQYFSSEFKIIDPGVVFGWLRTAVEQGYCGSLEGYLVLKLRERLNESGVSPVDRDLAKKFFDHFGIVIPGMREREQDIVRKYESEKRTTTLLTPEELGLLSPRVKYLEAKPVISIDTATTYIKGKRIEYQKSAPLEAPLGMRRTEITGRGTRRRQVVWEVIGSSEDRLVIRREGAGERDRLIPSAEFLKWEEDEELRQAREEAEALMKEAKNRPPPPTPDKDPVFEATRVRERERNKHFFGKDIDIPPLPGGITKEKISFWEQNGFELRFMPKERMDERKNFPGWQHKPGKKYASGNGIEFFEEADRISNLPENQSNPHLRGLHALDLSGTWMLWDKRGKPTYDNGRQSYDDDALVQAVMKDLVSKGIVNREAVDGLRNKIHPSMFSKPEFRAALSTALKIDGIPGAILRLPRTIETSVMGQGTDFHGTDTYEWCEEMYQSGERVACGSSVSGGVSCVYWCDDAVGSVGFRPLVVFPSP